jgi:hypothetical protein
MPEASVPAEVEDLLRRVYAAFNARDIDAVLAVMHPEVDWPDMIAGARVHGHAAVRDYWQRQFAAIDPRVDPVRFSLKPDGGIVTDVHQVVRDRDGNIVADRMVQHVYRFQDGLVTRMDVR